MSAVVTGSYFLLKRRRRRTKKLRSKYYILSSPSLFDFQSIPMSARHKVLAGSRSPIMERSEGRYVVGYLCRDL